jgi:hypothetical protein
MDQLPVRLSEVAASHNMPFLKMSISNIGLRTPPSSPENAKYSPRQLRFLLPKFLRRTQPSRSPTFFAQSSSTPNGPPPPLTSPVADNAPSHPTCSPFQTAQHVEEPFALVPPASPAPSDHSTNERPSPLRLRKAPLTYQNLRAVREDQHFDSKISKPVALLPSPVFSEMQIDQISSSYLTSHPSTDQQLLPDGPDQTSSLCEELDIISSYCENQETQTYSQNIKDTRSASPTRQSSDVKQRHDTRRDVGIVCAPSSFPHYQRRPHRDRSRSFSSEADWLAGHMSEKIMLEEWLCDLHQPETPIHSKDEEDGHHQIVSA